MKWLLNRLRNKSFVMTKYVFYFHVSDRIQNNLLLFSVNQEKTDTRVVPKIPAKLL